ncbi:AmmeMemoRadiSam system radical SAM enzyme [Candidatus Woesearchaeota archaeon]|nr:AmmeMemoRadiSam system radical SAM enzyme [Candidatus Woesearchaeota archaeon]
MQEALYYNSKKDGVVQCVLCPRNCYIQPEKVGFCLVRKNIDGKLYTLVYSRVAGGLAIDPIEKKPLFHFLPGTPVLSFGTVGCNLHCKHCQNWTTSQVDAGQSFEKTITPEEIVKAAKEKGCDSIAYTYNEPTIFYEFMLDTAKLAKKAGIKNTMVTNGFVNPKPLKELCKYMDGVNVDLKGFTNFFYGKTTTAWLQPVLDTLKTLKKEKVWSEITNLIIPTLNDNLDDIKKMCEWIKKNLGVDVPLHFTAFHPDFELRNLPQTPITTLVNAYDIAKSFGLRYVYVGNIIARDYENTHCAKCNALLIERLGFNVLQNNIVNGKCSCGEKIAGVF